MTHANYGDLRHLVAAIAGRHWARITDTAWQSWADAAHSILPGMRPLERRSLELAYRARGEEREIRHPPLVVLKGHESDEELFQLHGSPGLLALVDHGLLVVEGAQWRAGILDEIRATIDRGHTSYGWSAAPRMVLFGPDVLRSVAMDLGAELDLAGEAARAFSRVKVAEQLRLAISRLRAGWYVMPAGRSADAVIARIARSLAATDGSTKITQELMGEARSIMLSMNQMEGART